MQQSQGGVIYNMGWQFNYAGQPSSSMALRTFDYGLKQWQSTGLVITRFTPDTWYHVRAHYSISGSQITHNWIEIGPSGGAATRYTPTQANVHNAFTCTSTNPCSSNTFNNAFQLDLPSFDNALYHVYFDHANVGYNQPF